MQGNFGFVTKLGFNVYMSETDFLTAKMPVMNIIFISLSMCGRPAGVKSFSSSTGHLIKKKEIRSGLQRRWRLVTWELAVQIPELAVQGGDTVLCLNSNCQRTSSEHPPHLGCLKICLR